ncbi:MAG: hypothetical protein HY906_25215 [Deltaproteobacteria bacterium]|nr:hypothetical protein [Deltaproteobacteria bacterium]
MARVDLWYKLQKLLKFLLATLDPRIFTLLTRRGFKNQTRREGWALFMKAGGQHVDLLLAQPGDGSPGDQVGRIDDFENEWFDVVDAALANHFPELRQQVFLNLHKSSGPEVVLTVETLLARVAGLERLGDPGRAALELLAERGFTAEVRQRGRALIEQVTGPEVAVLPTPDLVAEAERQVAEDQAWAFYLEWAKTARTVVRRKDLRIKLGISTATRAEEPEEPIEPEPPAPAPLPPVPGPG